MSSPSYTDIGSLTEYFQRVRLPDGAADDYVMEYLHYALDRGEMVLSQLSPPYCLYLKAAPPVPGRRRSLNPCPLVVIRNAAGPGDPARIRLLVRKPAPAKPVEAERVPLHQWPEDEDGPSPTPTPTPPPSLKDRASAQLVEKLKRDQARNRVKSVPRTKPYSYGHSPGSAAGLSTIYGAMQRRRRASKKSPKAGDQEKINSRGNSGNRCGNYFRARQSSGCHWAAAVSVISRDGLQGLPEK